MKTYTKAVAVFLTAQLGGCYSYYQPPTSSNLAVLSIKNTTDRAIFSNTFKNNENCSGGSLLLTGDQGLPPGSSKNIEIAPDARFSYFVSYHTGITSGIDCFIVTSFMPKPNKHYKSEYAFDSNSGKCGINLKVVTENGWENEPSFIQREWLKPLLETSPRCK